MRTIILLIIALAVAATVATAQTQYDCYNQIGIYLAPDPNRDTAADLSVYNGAPGTFTAYVVMLNPRNFHLGSPTSDLQSPITVVGGFEFRVNLPPSVYLLDATLPPQAVNFATSPDFLAGCNAPVVDDHVTLLTMHLGEFSGNPGYIYLSPVRDAPQSIPGSMAITDYVDSFRLNPAFPVSGGYDLPVFGLWTYSAPGGWWPECGDDPFSHPLQTPDWAVAVSTLADTVLVGADADATDWYDAGFDGPDVTGLVTLLRPEWNVPGVIAFSRDIRAAYDTDLESRTWKIRISSGGRAPGIEMIIDFLPDPALDGVPLVLTDLKSGDTVEVTVTRRYVFLTDGTDRDLQLRIGVRDAPQGPPLVIFGGRTGTMTDRDNVITCASGATDGFDPGVDIPEPAPPPSNYLTVSVEHPDWPLGSRYSRDVSTLYDPRTDTRTWTILAETDRTGPVTLEFTPNFGRDAAIGLKLKDLATGQQYGLFPDLSYVFDADGTTVRRFELTVGGLPYPDLEPASRALATGWSIVSPPVAPAAGADDLASVILDQAPGYAAAYRYGTATGYAEIEDTDAITGGQAFWLVTDTPFTWTMNGYPLVEGVTLPLSAGWNLTGYPLWFNGPVEGIRVVRGSLEKGWNDAVAAGWVSAVMDYDMATDAYAPILDLETWHGYWVAALVPDVSLYFHWENFQTLPSRLSGAGPIARKTDGWRSELSLDDGSGRIRRVVIGAETGATDGYDGGRDAPLPPASPGGGSTLALLRPEWHLPTGPAVATDVVAPLDDRDIAWTVRITRPEPGPVTLSWSTASWPEGLDLELVRPYGDRLSVPSLREQDSVTLLTRGLPVDLVIRQAETRPETGVPFAGYALTAFPNPFNPRTTLAFDLPAEGRVEVRIYTVRGELVTTLGGTVLPAGRQSFAWEGTDRAGRAVPSGSYFARLLVDGERVGETTKMSLVR